MPIPLRVLIVEDSEDDAELLARELRRGGYAPSYERVDTAEAMDAALSRQACDIVVSDHSMVKFDSDAALSVLKASNVDAPFIIVSGTIGEEQAVQAMKAGASDYLTKGHLARLVPVVRRELADFETRRARDAAERALRDQELQSVLELTAAYEATLEGWARALDLRDRETEGHSRRVTDLTVRLARRMGISEAQCVPIRRGSLLHDIGKMGIPDSILRKPAPLTSEEWEVMRRHPTFARDLLAPIVYLGTALDIPYCHHEKWDGTGYPRGLKGEEIPLAARIFAVVDIWDAVRSQRSYSAAWPDDRALAHLSAITGTHLDPAVVAAFMDLLASLTPAPAEAGHMGTGIARGRILVADDYVANIELLTRWLTSDGYEVAVAHSGRDTLAAIGHVHPDLLLLDIDLTAPNGFAVCRQLKRDAATSDIPIILMSGLDPACHELTARHLGADDCVTKPVDAAEIKASIRRALDRAPARDA